MFDTQLAQAGSRRDHQTGSLSTPIYQTASFAHPALGCSTGFDYSRTANPTRQALEQTLAELEGGHSGFAFASGLAAIDAVSRLLNAGDRLVVTEDLYGGTYRLFQDTARRCGLDVVYVDTADAGAVQAALNHPSARALFVESPTNPLLKIADLRALSAMAHACGALAIADNTFLTCLQQRPLDQGMDLVIYSATKYLSGHNDVVAGAVITRSASLSEQIGFYQNAAGAILGPMDSWLVLRGIKTLSLRLARQQANASRIAAWLCAHPRVKRVRYPGLASHPGRDILKREQSGFGGMITFEIADPGRVPSILADVKVFLFAESLGGVESLMTYPLLQTHADMDPELLERLGIGRGVLRLSIGIEHADDLIADLERVL